MGSSPMPAMARQAGYIIGLLGDGDGPVAARRNAVAYREGMRAGRVVVPLPPQQP